MKQPKTIFLLSLIAAVLLLGVAYAAISDVTLQVTGNVTASPSDANFKVKFTNATLSTVKGSATGEAKITTTEKDATMELTGFSTLNDEVQVVFTIANQSADIYALLTLTKCEIASTNPEFFELTYNFNQNYIAPGGIATLTVNVKLVKTPIDAITAKANISFYATPAHTSEGGGSTSGGTNGNIIGIPDTNNTTGGGSNTVICSHTNVKLIYSTGNYDDAELVYRHYFEANCVDCGQFVYDGTEYCTFNGSGSCTVCGVIKETTGGNTTSSSNTIGCSHINTYIGEYVPVSTVSTQHYIERYCSDCGAFVVQTYADCTYVDGVCKYCGDVLQVIFPDIESCSHEKTAINHNIGAYDSEDGVYRHSWEEVCINCGESVRIGLTECTFDSSGYCTKCGVKNEK